jgi:hypothetical protein
VNAYERERGKEKRVNMEGFHISMGSEKRRKENWGERTSDYRET